MKRVLLLLTAFVLCLSMAGCGLNNSVLNDVTNALDNTAWEISAGTVTTAYAFKDGNIGVATEAKGIVFGEEQGKFSVTDTCIAIDWDDSDSGRVTELYYSYQDNTLRLYADEAQEKEITRVK